MPANDRTPAPFNLVVTPARAALVAGDDTTLQLLVRLQAPAAAPGTVPRAPLALALVLDRSGSMAGPPLEEAVKCARHIVDNLAATDRAAVIAFDDEVVCHAPLAPAGDKLALRIALAEIESGGSTDLHGGWRAGADQLAGGLANAVAGESVHRVILLSDGNANHGEQRLETIAGQCKELAGHGVGTSTYGLGRNFNEELMLAMAKAGRGSAYYGQTAADLAEPFEAEFALLTNLCARGLVLKVNAPDGIAVKMRNDYDAVEGDARAWKLPDVAFGSEAWALVELKVPAAMQAGAAAGSAISLPVTIAVEAAGAGSSPLFLMSALPPLPVLAAAEWVALAPDELVVRRADELEAGDVLDRVRAAIGRGDWDAAEHLLERAVERFGDNGWTRGIVEAIRRLVARREALFAMKEALYSKHAMSRRLASASEPATLADDDAVPLYLKRKMEQGKGRRH